MIPALLACAAAFGALLWQVMAGGTLVVLDGRVNAWLLPLRHRGLLIAFGWLTGAGEGVTAAAVGVSASGLLWAGGRAGLVMPFWVTLIGAEATTWSVKFLVARVRPPFLEGVTAASPSFPSAHATVSLAVYGFLALAVADGVAPEHRTAVFAAAALLILLIMFSRVFLSVHYLSDVLGGAVVAAFWLVIGWGLLHGPR